MENWEQRFNRVQTPDSSVPSHREELRKKLQSNRIPAGHGLRAAATLSIAVLVTLGALTLGYPSWAKNLWNTPFVHTITLRTKVGHKVVIKKIPLEECAGVCDTSEQMVFTEVGGRRAIAFKTCINRTNMTGDSGESFTVSTGDLMKRFNMAGAVQDIVVSTPDGENTWIVNGDTIDSKDITREIDRLPEVSTGPDQEIVDPNEIAASADDVPGVSADFELHQNYPNPFNPMTHISFDLKQSGPATLKVYNLMGQEVATLLNGHADAGHHTITFDGANLPTGPYLYTLEAAGLQVSRMMTLAK